MTPLQGERSVEGMADTVTVTITGLEGLELKIAQINAEIEEQCEEELDRVADQVQSDAKDNCPVDTGALQDDIKVYAEKLKRQIGNLNVYYSIFVHNGTYKMKARPYLLNASEANNSTFIQNMKNIKLSL